MKAVEQCESSQRRCGVPNLAADLEILDQALIAVLIGLLEVIQEPSPRIDHLDQAKTGTVIFPMLLEMLSE